MGPHLQTVPDVQPESQQSAGPLKVGDRLKARLDAADMMGIFELSSSGFYKQLKAGRFNDFELLPRIGSRKWSGAAVARYLAREDSRPVFGRRLAGR